jgi:hypothetical protein
MNTKICCRCNNEYPNDFKHFHRNKNYKDGLEYACIECERRRRLGTRYKPIVIPKDGYRICNKCNKELPATLEFFRECKTSKYGIRKTCRDCNRNYSKEYYKNNIELERNRHMKYYWGHREERLKRYSEWLKSANGKISTRKKHNYRRTLGDVELFPNPFDINEEIDWHHLNNNLMVSLPRDLHRLYPGKNHKDMCIGIVKQIYDIDKRILKL